MAQADGMYTRQSIDTISRDADENFILNLEPEQLTPRSKDEIWRALHTDKGKFIWGVYMKKTGVRHTGIVIQIGDRSFTIDYGGSGGKVEHASRLARGDDDTVDGAVQYTELADEEPFTKRLAIMQSFDLCEAIGESQAAAVATHLLAQDTTPYHLKKANCRHHVKRCIKRVIDVSKTMNIPFDIDPDTVLSKVEELMFGEGE